MYTIAGATAQDVEGLAVVSYHAWEAAYRGLLPDEVLDGRSVERLTANFARRQAAVEAGKLDHETLLVARDADRVAGWCAHGRPRDAFMDHPGVLELQALNVHPDYWGTGVAGELVTATIEQISAAGGQHTYLWVLDGNDRAQAFYRKWGWVISPEGHTKCEESRESVVDIMMVKSLAGEE